jgi:RNA polymerase sigma factor (sigma-70 family)
MPRFTAKNSSTNAVNQEPSDHTLLRRFRRGSQEAATQFYRRYEHRLRALIRRKCPAGLARRIDPDDISQAVFRVLFQGVNRGQYDVAAGETAWKLLVTLALNKVRTESAYQHAAKRDARLTSGNSQLEQCLELLTSGDGSDTFAELVIGEAVDRLPADHQRIIKLRLEGYQVAEIAERIGHSKRSVERFLHEARSRLASLFHEAD